MRLPKRITIKDQEWTVEQRWAPREGGEVVDGVCRFPQRTLIIDNALSTEDKLQTFFHEAFHAMCFELGLHRTVLNKYPDIEEILADNFARWLTITFDLRKKKK